MTEEKTDGVLQRCDAELKNTTQKNPYSGMGLIHILGQRTPCLELLQISLWPWNNSAHHTPEITVSAEDIMGVKSITFLVQLPWTMWAEEAAIFMLQDVSLGKHVLRAEQMALDAFNHQMVGSRDKRKVEKNLGKHAFLHFSV